jgi:hypothetical protein
MSPRLSIHEVAEAEINEAADFSSLMYSAREHEIRKLAVAHHKRRPFYWRGRR